MFGSRYSSLFKSRWNALLWAAGILWAAYSFASNAPTSHGTDAANGTETANADDLPDNAEIAAAIKSL